MRELVFALEYAPGNNAVADILTANPKTEIRSLSDHVIPDNLWRVDHVTGGQSALDGLTETVAVYVLTFTPLDRTPHQPQDYPPRASLLWDGRQQEWSRKESTGRR